MTYTFRITSASGGVAHFNIEATNERRAWDRAWEVWWEKERTPGTKMNLIGINRP